MADLVQQGVAPAAQPRFRLRFAVRTDVGQVRSENQDSYGYVRTNRATLFVVADGMGGAGGGATASTIAVNILTRTSVETDGQITEASLRRAIDTTHQAIFEASRTEEGLTKMGTTVVALVFSGRNAIIAHVGDSRLYLWREGQICQLTRDHTLVQELVDSGTISVTDAEHHPMAHYLTRSLSPESAARAEVHTYPYPIQSGDKYLLCCDGLYNLVSEEDVSRILAGQPIEPAVKTLVDLANERGGNDNITVELIEVQELAEGEADEEMPPAGEPKVILSTDFATSTLSEEVKTIVRNAIVASRHVNGTAKHPTADASGSDSAVEGLIFSDSNPTSDQIQRHEDRVRSTQQSGKPRAPEEGEDTSSPNTGDRRRPTVDVPRPAADGALTKKAEVEKRSGSNVLMWSLLVGMVLAIAAGSFVIMNPSLAPRETVQQEVAEVIPAPPVESAPTVPTEVQPPQVAPVEPEPPITDQSVIEDQRSREAARIIADASNLDIPPPPSAAPGEGQIAKATPEVAQPNQPIDWEQEKVTKVAPTENAPTPTSQPVDRAELQSITEKKSGIRDQILDIDAKIRQFRIKSREEAEQQVAALEAQVNEVGPALDLAARNFETAKRRYQLWLDRKAVVDLKGKEGVVKLAEEVAISSVPVKRRKEAFEIASLRYSDTVELWTENPADNEAASRMAELGRELRTRRANLEEAIITAINTEVNQALFDVSDWGVILADLGHKKERLQRHIGFLKAFTPDSMNERTRREEQQKLFDERQRLRNELDQLSQRASAEAELDFRRSVALEQSGLPRP